MTHPTSRGRHAAFIDDYAGDDSRERLSDAVVARLRTIVPALWGALVTWLLALLAPHLPDGLHQALADWLSSDAGGVLAVALATAAWYIVWQRVGPHVPDWLVRLAMGSAQTPVYSAVPVDLTVTTVPPLTASDRTELAALAAALDEGDPGREALARLGILPSTYPRSTES